MLTWQALFYTLYTLIMTLYINNDTNNWPSGRTKKGLWVQAQPG